MFPVPRSPRTNWLTDRRGRIGASVVANRPDLDVIASKKDMPGAPGMTTAKFVISGLNQPAARQKTAILDSARFQFHAEYGSQVLGVSEQRFVDETYFDSPTRPRKNMAGTIVAHDSFAEGATKGLYAFEFWPSDNVSAKHIVAAYESLRAALPFADGKLRYHPAGYSQEKLVEAEAAALAHVPVVSTTQLLNGASFSLLNEGKGVGTLRIYDPDDKNASPPAIDDVVIYKAIPNDASHVAGIITEEPQTPLSHVNLKAQQNDTPNLYVKDASSQPEIAALVGKRVFLEVKDGAYVLREARPEDEVAKPPRPTITLKSDLTRSRIISLETIRHGDWTAYGAKSANLGELRMLARTGQIAAQVPEGFALPFSFYETLMTSRADPSSPTLFEQLDALHQLPNFETDPKVREEALKDFRKAIRKAKFTPAQSRAIATVEQQLAGKPIRCRSSTNIEDLPGFNGAGLHDSHTHRDGEGPLEETVKQVCSSLFTFRAFEERRAWNIDHKTAKMGVTLHHNMDDEQANGVAITRNLFSEFWKGFYVNAQVGESLVTNPPKGATPEELHVFESGNAPNDWERQYIRHSSLQQGNVLSDEAVQGLIDTLPIIQEHFKNNVYGSTDKKFAMDVELKVDKDGTLVVKQARPVVSKEDPSNG